MKIHSFLVFGVLLMLLSCKDESQTCESVHADLQSMNVNGVKDELDPWLAKLDPDATTEDPIGHQHNLQTFIDRLGNQCSLQTDLICYACIETYPEQSEIKIVLDSVGHQIHRVLDISTPENNVMIIRSIHR